MAEAAGRTGEVLGAKVHFEARVRWRGGLERQIERAVDERRGVSKLGRGEEPVRRANVADSWIRPFLSTLSASALASLIISSASFVASRCFFWYVANKSCASL